jgi:hypothetical protein
MTLKDPSVTSRDEVVRRTVELAEIPAPTGLEAARQERVRTWWLEDGWADVRADEAGNLWARVRPGAAPARPSGPRPAEEPGPADGAWTGRVVGAGPGPAAESGGA